MRENLHLYVEVTEHVVNGHDILRTGFSDHASVFERDKRVRSGCQHIDVVYPYKDTAMIFFWIQVERPHQFPRMLHSEVVMRLIGQNVLHQPSERHRNDAYRRISPEGVEFRSGEHIVDQVLVFRSGAALVVWLVPEVFRMLRQDHGLLVHVV